MTQVRSMLSDLDRKQDLALLCINDDVHPGEEEDVGGVFSAWQEGRFSHRAAWERVA